MSNLSAPNASFVVADNDDSIAHGLSLQDNGETVTLWAEDGLTKVTQLAWGDEAGGDPPDVTDASLVLYPEVYGTAYVKHGPLGTLPVFYSPGRQADGSDFEGPDGVYGP
ncbi:MAG: hypothetical protein JRI25_20170 [Deltaproteobacteria bacterium]|nr:hypothetical protein [Deltaproteobacteria bacterium]